MGSKFCNLNIRGVTRAALAAVKPEFCGYECAEGWLTVTSPLFEWGSTQKYAKELSASLPAPVLSTEYYDDDYVEFALYDSGKLVAKHVPVTYEDLPKKGGNAAWFLHTLGLNTMDEPLLKKVFSVTDCEQSVCLLESLFGCPIWGVREEIRRPTKRHAVPLRKP